MSEQVFTEREVLEHNREGDCWLIIEGKVYDVTDFLDDHPGSFVPIVQYAGKDATQVFLKKPHSAHAKNVMLPKYFKGVVKKEEPKPEPKTEERRISAKNEVKSRAPVEHDHKVRKELITWSEFVTHDHKESLWILVKGKVYDVTNFKTHPGSFDKLLQVAAKDGTKEFDRVGHKKSSIDLMEKYYIGDIDTETIESEIDHPTPLQPNWWKYTLMMAFAGVSLFLVGYIYG